MKLKKFKFSIFFIFLSILVLIVKFDFFLNIYIILKNNSESRMTSSYGYCYPQGYGFIKESIFKHNLKKQNINTKNSLVMPSSNIFSFSFNNKKSLYEIFINYEQEKLENIVNKFDVIESKKNCYLIKYLND